MVLSGGVGNRRCCWVPGSCVYQFWCEWVETDLDIPVRQRHFVRIECGIAQGKHFDWSLPPPWTGDLHSYHRPNWFFLAQKVDGKENSIK